MEGAEMWVVDGSEGRLIVCRCRVKVVPSYEPYLRALVGTTLASMQILARVCTATRVCIRARTPTHSMHTC